MADLKATEKRRLEQFFEMGGGYVCNFSNRTFRDFVIDYAGIDLYDEGYFSGFGSKAVRLRNLWQKEPNNTVAKLTEEMLAYWKSEKNGNKVNNYYDAFDPILFAECEKIVARLRATGPIENADAILPNSDDKDFDQLAKSIRESIGKGQSSEVIDRLHTFFTKYMRVLCERHKIAFDKDVALDALFGGYVKFLRDNGHIESEMTKEILSSAIKILRSFNTVRNNHSYAHDNPILNENESVFAVSNIASSLKFIGNLESKIEQTKKEEATADNLGSDVSDKEIEAAADAWIQMEIDIRRGK